MVEELRILDEQTLFNTTANYVIPRYQRAYAWEDKEIKQLIDDINGINESENYFIGSLIVSKLDKQDIYEVVDGQQRLTTLYLILQYLETEGFINCLIQPTLSFDCRPNSNYTLHNIKHLFSCLANKTAFPDDDKIELSIINGAKAIRQKFASDNINKKLFTDRLRRVILYRIKVPENTDLNRYFEIMNTRGEQLEQHDILKARLMSNIKAKDEQAFFARLWDACSDMTGYVQMHLSPKDRESIFGDNWNDYLNNDWDYYKSHLGVRASSSIRANIKEIVSNGFKIGDTDEIHNDVKHLRFESIIDFPHFLLHTLRVFVKIHGVSLDRQLGELLDDKKLIDDFESVINFAALDTTPIQQIKENFSKKFIITLIQTRFLFDKYIIKREFSSEDIDGEWSLKELQTPEQRTKKKAYYINTKLDKQESANSLCHKECLMIQSALRVSYTSPKVMHWITDLLVWLHQNNAYLQLTSEAERIARQATQENFINGNDFRLGVKTPHIVFNYLDYLLWKNNKAKYDDFVFEFRNSVEHWYPQHPSDDSFRSWDNNNTFGNLCIISRSVNSKFSNLSPESKMKSYSKMVNRGSLKLRIMGQIIQNSSNEAWINTNCQEHENEMISILKKACDISD